MHIVVYCPGCRSRYQLDPAMRGQRMRCPNAMCREVFEVCEEEPVGPRPDQAVEPPGSVYHVGDQIPLIPIEEETAAPTEFGEEGNDRVIPVLPAEIARDARRQEPREAHSWDEPPPVRRPASAAGTTTQAAPLSPRSTEDDVATEWPAKAKRRERRPRTTERHEPSVPLLPATEAHVTSPDRPVELAEGDWEPPPVRQRPESLSEVDDAVGGGKRRRTSSLVALLMALIGLGVIGGGGWLIWSKVAATEEKQFTEARRDYDEGKFGAAARMFRQLEKAYPKSESQGVYRFFAHLSEVRNDAQSLVEPAAAFERLEGFLQAHKENPLLADYRVDLWETTHKLVQGFTEAAREKKSRELWEKAHEVLKLADSFKPPDVDASRRLQAETALASVKQDLDRLEQRTVMVKWATDLPPTVENLIELRRRLEEARLLQDPEFQKLIARKEEELRQLVRYVEVSEKIPLPAETVEPCLLVEPLVAPRVRPPSNGRVVLALVRGVLYGLDQGSGKIRWATRVGVDTAALPLRLPATDTTPEVFLVLSAERNTLRAVSSATGESLWEHRLSAPCLGRPTIIRRRVYVPTVAGRVEELEIIQGHQLGYFELPGQRLTVGGAWQADTNLLYIPGDGQTTYVLDVAQKKCVATLDTGHPSGSLRAAPILVNRPTASPEDTLPPAYLILSQAEGLGAMKLRVFDVHPEQKSATLALSPEPRIDGWSWFPAYHDGEKLSFATDKGILGLYGINQFRNVDKALFAELRESPPLGIPSSRPQRAQVVHAEENDFWVLANGQLQRLHLDRFAQKVAPVWPNALPLGAPLHEGQVDETGKVLFVVTQSDAQQTCLATAVGASDGQIRWQMQLGVECAGEPVLAGGQVLALDQGGGVFAFDPAVTFDPARKQELAGAEWILLGGQLLARPTADGLRWTQTRVSPDGSTVVLAGAPASGKELLVRRVQLGAKGPKPDVTEQRLSFPIPLAGSPALGQEHALLLLRDGSLLRLSLTPGAESRHEGPNWRSERAEEDAVGFAAWLSAEEFVTTNGLGGLVRWRWRANEVIFAEVGRSDDKRPRIVSVPLVLPNDQVCVADVLGRLTLLQGPKLKEVRFWQMPGQITAGPFLRGERIGCVVDRRRLVWLDPAENNPIWEYQAGEAIVGQPQLVGDLLLVADQAGRFVALDPATGRPHGPGYALKASVAPSTSPIAYGPQHALVPLTDGTLFLLPLRQVATPRVELPWVW